jgi:hypothetical protein
MKSQQVVRWCLLCVVLVFAAAASADAPKPNEPSESRDEKQKSKKPQRILPPAIDAAAAGAEAIKQFDANHDGNLSGKELDRCPGLKAALPRLDPSGKGEVTAKRIAARIRIWQASRIGLMAMVVKVLRNGKPLEGAQVKFVPEKFLGKNFKAAVGKTDDNGMAPIAIPQPGPPGVALGFYRVEITKSGEKIPAKYNTHTVLGLEVAPDLDEAEFTSTFDLKDDGK